MDSQWWLTAGEKPDCSTNSDWSKDLADMLSGAKNPRDTIVATHHPIVTHGTHGGFYDWKAHIFPLTDKKPYLYVPLPIVGSLYPLFREYVVKSEQDIVSDEYKSMRDQWAAVYKEHPPFIHAAGHDHNLQVLTGNDSANDANTQRSPKHLLVSGAGSKSKISRVGHGEDTRFAHAHSGFMVVDYFDDTSEMEPGSVLLRVVEPATGNSDGSVVYPQWLRGGPTESTMGSNARTRSRNSGQTTFNVTVNARPTRH